MCIFSKTLAGIEKPSRRHKERFNFIFWCDKQVNKIILSIHSDKVAKQMHENRWSLLGTYEIFPPKFDILRALSYSGATLGIGTAAGVGVPVAGTAAGFTSSGIAAGVQSSIGSVAAGSTFATLQSIGATGEFAILGPISLIAGAVGNTIVGSTFLGIGIDKHVKEIESFAERTYLILPHL